MFFSDMKIQVKELQIKGSIISQVARQCVKELSQLFFSGKNIVLADSFELVWWDGIKMRIADYPKLYDVWVTKRVPSCCAFNKMKAHQFSSTSKLCPFLQKM